MPRLNDDEIGERLGTLAGWRREGDRIVRRWRFPSFTAAIGFVNRVAALAEQQDHHPDILVHYVEVTLTLWSHDAGGLTERDFRLAARIDGLGVA
jgi:4a-hydroxytetrahydrobiopterin dehydratase